MQTGSFKRPILHILISKLQLLVMIFNLIRAELSQRFLPNISVLGGSKNVTLELLNNKYVNGKTIIYVCENGACQLPVEDVVKAIEQITAR